MPEDRQQSRSTHGRYIPEIQGLRTVAALLVAIYHIWFNRVSGGVDVFFVVAAFFMMTSLARQDRIGVPDLLRYWSGTVRRVCPVMVLVVCTTLVALYLFDIRIEWRDAIYHATASTIFIENWWLAWSGADYLDAEAPPSAFQQMWALSLQVQLAFLLPFLLFLAGIGATALRATDLRRTAGRVLAILFAVSFTYSLWMTRSDQPWAYFDSLARIWEYAAGALLGLYAHRLPRLSDGVARVLGYGAFFVVISFAAVLPVARLFPGVAALIPVLSTLVIVWVARGGTPIAPLRWKPVLALGDISFAFYLWHWPVLIIWRHLSDSSEIGLTGGLVIILISGLLAAVSVRFVEQPMRRSNRLSKRPALGLAAGLSLGIVSCFAIGLFAANYMEHKDRADARFAAFKQDPEQFQQAFPEAVVPPPMIVRTLWRQEYSSECHQTLEAAKVIECHYGVEDGRNTILVHGGSHSIQWLPALMEIADDLDARIVQMTKVGCPSFDGHVDPGEVHEEVAVLIEGRDPSCIEWNRASKRRIAQIDPELVFTIATRGTGLAETIPDNHLSWWISLAEAGSDLLVLRDNPRFVEDVPSCTSRHEDVIEGCSLPRSQLLAEDDPGADLDLDKVTYLDLSDLFCDQDWCWPVRDGVLIYRDSHHITGTYARLSAERLRAPIQAIFESRQLAMKGRINQRNTD